MITRIAIIGAGEIAPYHIQAVQKIGVEIVGICATPDSENARKIGIEHRIRIFSNLDDLISSKVADGFIICVNSKNSVEIVKKLGPLGFPILLEKPGAISSQSLKELQEFSHLLTIGYNRRFYESVKAFQKLAPGSGIVEINIGESSKYGAKEDMITSVLTNSVHILDLIGFLLGDFDFINPRLDRNAQCFLAELIFENVHLAGTIKIFFQTPVNSQLKLYSGSEVHELRPIEVFSRFNSFDVEEPTLIQPLRKYHPSWNGQQPSQVVSTSETKPGFVDQLANFISGEFGPKSTGCSLEDAITALARAELIAEAISQEFRKDETLG